ncbi:hypothetical protein AB0B25_02120 [Nocardia sp. NPDC049190]|uniref:hypothetical protein n=1 Tax=Nocardia sp. NPDC049190 TaxID=3155650 RepID=UPI003402A4EA
MAITIALFIIPAVVGAVAVAQAHSGLAAGAATGRSSIAMLYWMDIRDSNGVRLTDYVWAIGRDSAFSPAQATISVVVGLQFIGYLVIVTSAVWLIGFAISFQWLDPIGRALTGVANSLTGQIATPMMLAVAVSIGAFFVGWFVVRGFVAKATIQVVTMLGVAVLGPVVLAEPLADVLSSNGLLAQGRDLGIAVAAGLNGSTDRNPKLLVATIQGDLVDNFARRPVQVWNFGHVVDQSPRCAAVWSTGVQSGDSTVVLEGMRTCGDMAAYTVANNPSLGQIGSGLVLLLCGSILLVFGASLGVKIIRAALDAIYHMFLSIFGFAAGGFVYGPTQTFLVRNLVDAVVAAGRMAAYIIYLGVYALFLGNLFRQAGDQVGVVLVLGAIVEVIAISQLKRLSVGLGRGNEWIANRFALTIQGAGSSGGGGTALGMGSTGSDRSLPKAALAGLSAINTVAGSPITARIFGRRSPFDLGSKLRHDVDMMKLETDKEIYENGWPLSQARSRGQLIAGAKAAAEEHGHTPRGAAAAVDNILSRGGFLSEVVSCMIDAGFKDEAMMEGARYAHHHQQSLRPNVWKGDTFLGDAVASIRMLGDDRSPANIALFRQAAHRLARLRYVDNKQQSALTKDEQKYLEAYVNNPTSEKAVGIKTLANGKRDSEGKLIPSKGQPPLPTSLEGWSQASGKRMSEFIMPHLSQKYLAAAEAGDVSKASEYLAAMQLLDT